MTDILIRSPVPSLFIQTKSASTFVADTSTDTNAKQNSYANNLITEHSLLTVDHHTTCLHQTFDETYKSTVLTTNSKMNNRQEENIRDVSVHFIDKSLTSMTNYDDNNDVSYAIINRKYSNLEQSNDFPENIIEQFKNQKKHVENNTMNHLSKLSNKTTINHILPSNVLKPMNYLNTIFIKPTKIEQSLPKLVFQDDESYENSKSMESIILNESDCDQNDERSSSPIFYERPGLSELDDDIQDSETCTRRVKFSTAPIRVYPTYSPYEYDRRNDEIDPFSASAEYELEKRIEKMNVFNVEIEKASDGLGISVLGMGVGADSGLEKLGIFVKSLNPQGVVAKDGRIQVGDQIIEVNQTSLVGVTHSFAKTILQQTSGLVKLLIGREKDDEKSEISALIQQSLQLDREQEEISRTLQQYNNENSMSNNSEIKQKISDDIEIEILKQCYESLEEALETTEKEKEHYQQLYQQTHNELKQVEEKYIQATLLIQELQDRQTQLHQQHMEIKEQLEKRISELMVKIEQLEKTICVNSISKSEENLLPKTMESLPSDISECILNRTHTSSSQQSIFTNRCNTTTSSVRFPSLSLDKLSTGREQFDESASTKNKSADQIDMKTDEILSMNKIYTKKIYSSSKHLSTPSLENDTDTNNIKTSISKVSSLEQTNNGDLLMNEYIEIKDWTLDQCIQWLTAQAMTPLIPIFLNRSINGEKLLLLDNTKMKTMGIKSSKVRDQLKSKIKELKHVELNRLRERFLRQPSSSSSFHRSVHNGNHLRSLSLTKLKERKLFGSTSSGK